MSRFSDEVATSWYDDHPGDATRDPLGAEFDKLANTIHNERLKLLASAFNTVAAFTLTAGFIGPAVSIFWSLGPQPPDLRLPEIILGALAWFLAAAGLHWLGSLILKSMRDT